MKWILDWSIIRPGTEFERPKAKRETYFAIFLQIVRLNMDNCGSKEIYLFSIQLD